MSLELIAEAIKSGHRGVFFTLESRSIAYAVSTFDFSLEPPISLRPVRQQVWVHPLVSVCIDSGRTRLKCGARPFRPST